MPQRTDKQIIHGGMPSKPWAFRSIDDSDKARPASGNGVAKGRAASRKPQGRRRNGPGTPRSSMTKGKIMRTIPFKIALFLAATTALSSPAGAAIETGNPTLDRYDSLFEDAAAEHEFPDPLYLKSIAWWESNQKLDPEAVSSDSPCGGDGLESKSIGIFQVTKGCGEGEGYTTEQLMDPAINIDIGTKHLVSIYKDMQRAHPGCTQRQYLDMTGWGWVQSYGTITGCGVTSDERQTIYSDTVGGKYEEWKGAKPAPVIDGKAAKFPTATGEQVRKAPVGNLPEQCATDANSPQTANHFITVDAADVPKTQAMGFNVASVENPGELAKLPAGVKGVAMDLMGCGGVTSDFKSKVAAYRGAGNLSAVYVMDEPTPETCDPANVNAQVDYLNANLPGVDTMVVLHELAKPYADYARNAALVGADPYPCETNFCDYGYITRVVNDMIAGGVDRSRIVPTYQAYGKTGEFEAWSQ